MERAVLRKKVNEINKKIKELKKELGDQPIIMCDEGSNNNILRMTNGSFTNKNLFHPTIAFTINGVVLMELDTQHKSSNDEYEYRKNELLPFKFPIREKGFHIGDTESKTPMQIVAIDENAAKRKIAEKFNKKYENLENLERSNIKKEMAKNIKKGENYGRK